MLTSTLLAPEAGSNLDSLRLFSSRCRPGSPLIRPLLLLLPVPRGERGRGGRRRATAEAAVLLARRPGRDGRATPSWTTCAGGRRAAKATCGGTRTASGTRGAVASGSDAYGTVCPSSRPPCLLGGRRDGEPARPRGGGERDRFVPTRGRREVVVVLVLGFLLVRAGRGATTGRDGPSRPRRVASLSVRRQVGLPALAGVLGAVMRRNTVRPRLLAAVARGRGAAAPGPLAWWLRRRRRAASVRGATTAAVVPGLPAVLAGRGVGPRGRRCERGERGRGRGRRRGGRGLGEAATAVLARRLHGLVRATADGCRGGGGRVLLMTVVVVMSVGR